MPFKHYHGRTGVVFNVTKRAIGVTVNKSVSWEWIESNEQLCIGSVCSLQIAFISALEREIIR